MGDIIPFRTPEEPLDKEMMIILHINGAGEIELVINSYVETKDQHNWVISKMVEATARIVDRKKDID